MSSEPEPVKTTTATYGAIPSVPWWKSPQIIWSVSGACSSAVILLKFLALTFGWHLTLPFTTEQLEGAVLAALALGGNVYFFYRRLRAGNDPSNPTPRITT